MKYEEYNTGKPVVRMLSFCKKTEEGDIIRVSLSNHRNSNDSKASSEYGSLKNLTSTDLKKSRRTSSTLQRTPPSGVSLLKSASFSTNEVKKYEQLNVSNLKNLDETAIRKSNKLILRVPSAADEHESKKVFYSECVNDDGNDDVNHFKHDKKNPHMSHNGSEPSLEFVKHKNLNSTSDAVASDGICVISNLYNEQVPFYVNKEEIVKNIIDSDRTSLDGKWEKSRSTTNLIAVSQKTKPVLQSRDYPVKDDTVSSLSSEFTKDYQDRWKNSPTDPSHGSSDVGSTSLSNFSSRDGLSMPSQMGSTSRLITQKKYDRRWSCGSITNYSTLISILSITGSLANFIRLPRMVYYHGGGVFLLVYIIVSLMFGIPLAFLEIGLGQFCQHGTIKLWGAVSLFKGVGYSKVLISFIMSIYYITYSAVAASLLTWDFQETSAKCSSVVENKTEKSSGNEEKDNKECMLSSFWDTFSQDASWFWINIMFLFLVWSIVAFCVMKKSRSFKLALNFIIPTITAFLILLIIESLSRGSNGISQLLVFRWSKLFDVHIWFFSFTQMFMSCHIGFGNISTLAGRIYPKSNALWSAVAQIIGNIIIGVLSVCLIYLWLDQLQSAGVEISPSNVNELFVLDVIYNMTVNSVPSWHLILGIVGNIMIILAGFSSALILAYATLVAVFIELKRKWHWWHVAFIFCFLGFILGIISMIPKNLSVPHVIDYYVIGQTVIAFTCLELVGFVYIYGVKNLYQDFEFVVGSPMGSYWKVIWMLTPIILIIVQLCMLFIPYEDEISLKDEVWKHSLGWVLYVLTLIIILATAAYQIYKQVDYNLSQKFLSSIKPSRNWGPVDPIYRHCWVQWRNRYQMTGRGDFTLKRRGTRDYTYSIRLSSNIADSPVNDTSDINHSSSEWTYVRSISSGPYHLHTEDNHHICWRKNESF